MKQYATLSALGRDRIGIADDIAAAVEKYDVEIDETRMTALGGEFAGILLVSGESGQIVRDVVETTASCRIPGPYGPA